MTFRIQYHKTKQVAQIYFISMQTLTALQQARLELGAFPCLPDAMTVCGLIAADMAGKRIAEQVDKTYDAKNAAPKQRPGGGEKAEKTEKTVRARSL